ncbi:pentatricopeptide repeat-containing protein At5g66631 [Andrographis paniculata]|uniref:pentatricopeptide repeat-containing protein At5g66631 n=1 Tax=Andrographis paniculata TaxID=175694 RepID=UPI0021E7FC7E|nr:pentatricopeptide repeat-containing protein At5g66631 [Andrographis paniculata]
MKRFCLEVNNFGTITRDSNKVSLYFERAKIIDSIRLCLHSNVSQASLVSMLSNARLDSFVVAAALRSAPSPASALSMVEGLKQVKQFSHSQLTLRAVAKILARSGQTRRLGALIDAINAGRFGNIRPVGCMDCMRWYADAGDLDAVLRVWDEWRRTLDGARPCAESYNVVMEVYVDKGMDEDAVKVFYRMVDEGALPNCRTYTIVMRHLIEQGKADHAMELFRLLSRMRIKRTVKQYSMLVDAFSGIDDLNSVKVLLDEMRADGILPGRAMASSLRRMKEAGYVEETEELVGEMMLDERVTSISYSMDSDEDDIDDKDGEKDRVFLKPWLDPAALAQALRDWDPNDVATLKGANLTWTSRLVCKLIRSFKSAETAWKFFGWVAHQPGFVHDVYTASRMIAKLARDGHAELVDRLLSKLDREGIRLSFTTVRLVIDFYGLSKNGVAALTVFRNVETICGGPVTKPGRLILYSSLLRTLSKCEMTTEALNALEEMILSGISPDLQTFAGMMHDCAVRGDIKTVQRLFGIVRQSGIEPDGYTYASVIRAYCKSERASLALRVWEDMRGSGLMPDLATKELLVKSLWKEGKLREAARVEETGSDAAAAAVAGHLYTVSAADLARVCRIYSATRQP